MNEEYETIERLNFENWIWVIFIIISVADIYGDELIKKNILNGQTEAAEEANSIFFMIILVSLLVYIYFFCRNYYDYKTHHNKSYQVRLIGSILILVGTLCLFYHQLVTTTNIDTVSNI